MLPQSDNWQGIALGVIDRLDRPQVREALCCNRDVRNNHLAQYSQTGPHSRGWSARGQCSDGGGMRATALFFFFVEKLGGGQKKNESTEQSCSCAASSDS